jgi:gliding motility-associated-like protein
MILRLRLSQLLLALLLIFSSQKSFSQCFQIESILVDACDTGADEGLNEMVRFKVGNAAVNTSNLSVTWPNNAWTGLIQNAATAAKVVILNTQVQAAGGCGQILEPTGGVLPANAKVVLVTSHNFGVTANVFGALTQNIYIIFQNNPNVTAGHFANYNAASSIRTLTMNFGSCSDTVSYDRSLLVNTNGTSGGSAALQNGSTVNFTDAGIASYANMGCVAPVDIFMVDAGVSVVNACPGATISLSGSAVGQIGVAWTALTGTFSASTALNTNYTLPVNASGTIVLVLTATNSCNNTITDIVTVNVTSTVTPAFSAVAPICTGAALAPLPTTSVNGITGSWSPALNNTATTTYTFTPNAGQCSNTATLTITVTSPVTPTFNPVPAICSGATLSPLPTTSTNGITGTWSPALSNTATTTYTFTPNAGQCSTTTTLTITVNQGNTVPTFIPVNTICPGAQVSPLIPTSTNGITGVWTPAFNNQAPTTYTFTPNAGQCATTTTLTVTVVNLVTPAFNTVAAVCAGATIPPLPTTSTNNITGTWSPALNNLATTVYTFTPTAGQCASTATLTVTVIPANTIPTFNPVAAVCSGTAVAALPTTSLNGIVGTWSPALNNTATTTYTFTPNAGQCAVTTILTVVVNVGITPTFNQVAAICTGDALSALPTTSLNGITGSWSPALNNAATTTYTFTPDTAICPLTATMTIVVNPANTVPTFTAIGPVCNGANLFPLPTTSMNNITGSWSPALNNTATTTYTFTPDAGQCATTTTLEIIIGNGIDFVVNGACSNNNFVFRIADLNATFDMESANYIWKNNSGAIVGNNEPTFNATAYLNSTAEIEQLPLTFTVTVNSAEDCTKTVPFVLSSIYCDIQKGISPNNDTKNDFFDLAMMDVRKLEIFNRYGTVVYTKSGYTNQWHGQSEKGEELPDGTYYYVIEFNSNSTAKTGWIYINKEAN